MWVRDHPIHGMRTTTQKDIADTRYPSPSEWAVKSPTAVPRANVKMVAQ
jgi:hypothetical protein